MHPTWSGTLRLLVCIAVLLPSPLSETGAVAQDWSQPWADPDDRPARVDISASIGFLAPTDWSDLVLIGSISSATGIFEQVLVRDLRVDPDKEFGAAVTYWKGRYGLRVQGGFSRSSVTVGATLPSVFQPIPSPDDVVSVDVDTYLYSVGGAIGFLEYKPELWVWPYGFGGIGGITYDLARRVSPPLLTFIQSAPRAGGRGDVIIADSGREFLLAIDELDMESVFAVNFGVGADFRVPLGPAGIGLRLELSDHIASSPVGIQVAQLQRVGAIGTTGLQFGLVHHFRFEAGFVIQFGR